MAHQMDEIGLQRLVDGTLDADRRRQLLVELDRAPELWREVALAFVEEQVLRTELGAGLPLQEDSRELPAKPRPLASSTRTSIARTSMAILAIVASLFLVFSFGFRWGQWKTQPLPGSAPPQIAAGDDTELPQPTLAESEAAYVQTPQDETSDSAPTYRLIAAHRDGESFELPLFEKSQMGDLPWDLEDSERLKQFAETLARCGYRADMQTEYLSGRLDDGRQIVVPWRTVSVKYAAQ